MGGNSGERVEFAEFYKDLNFEGFLPPERTICNGPISYIGQQEVANDLGWSIFSTTNTTRTTSSICSRWPTR
jgi:hypothetical protein